MGSTASAPDLSALEQVCGQTAIAKEDPFWQTLLTAKVPLQRGDASAANVEQIATNLCTELMRNNATTGNFQVLLLCTLEHMEKAVAPRATPEQLSQCAAALVLVRLFLRHMVETLEAEARRRRHTTTTTTAHGRTLHAARRSRGISRPAPWPRRAGPAAAPRGRRRQGPRPRARHSVCRGAACADRRVRAHRRLAAVVERALHSVLRTAPHLPPWAI